MLKYLFPCLLLLCACTTDRQGGTRTEADNALVVLFTGDVLLDRGVRQAIERHNVSWLFRNVAATFRQADATVVNLECPITNHPNPLFKRFVFRADSAWAYALRDVGITHAALANNHTNDQGVNGVAQTQKTLLAAGIASMGCGESPEQRMCPIVIRKDSLQLAVFNAVFVPLENWNIADSGFVQPNACDAKSLAEAIQDYKSERPDSRIVVFVHWGFEFQHTPSVRQHREAILLAEAGADVIIGHHPHVIQAIEHIGQTQVIYSLGNFVFDQHRADGNQALMAEVVLTADTMIVSQHKVAIEHCCPRILE